MGKGGKFSIPVYSLEEVNAVETGETRKEMMLMYQGHWNSQGRMSINQIAGAGRIKNHKEIMKILRELSKKIEKAKAATIEMAEDVEKKPLIREVSKTEKREVEMTGEREEENVAVTGKPKITKEIIKATGTLSSRQKEAMINRTEGLNEKESAELIGCKPEEVRGLLMGATRKIYKHLGFKSPQKEKVATDGTSEKRGFFPPFKEEEIRVACLKEEELTAVQLRLGYHESNPGKGINVSKISVVMAISKPRVTTLLKKARAKIEMVVKRMDEEAAKAALAEQPVSAVLDNSPEKITEKDLTHVAEPSASEGVKDDSADFLAMIRDFAVGILESEGIELRARAVADEKKAEAFGKLARAVSGVNSVGFFGQIAGLFAPLISSVLTGTVPITQEETKKVRKIRKPRAKKEKVVSESEGGE